MTHTNWMGVTILTTAILGLMVAAVGLVGLIMAFTYLKKAQENIGKAQEGIATRMLALEECVGARMLTLEERIGLWNAQSMEAQEDISPRKVEDSCQECSKYLVKIHDRVDKIHDRIDDMGCSITQCRAQCMGELRDQRAKINNINLCQELF